MATKIEIMGRLVECNKQYLYTKKAVAERLGVHPNTVYNALNQGVTHPLYKRIIKVIKELK